MVMAKRYFPEHESMIDESELAALRSKMEQGLFLSWAEYATITTFAWDLEVRLGRIMANHFQELLTVIAPAVPDASQAEKVAAVEALSCFFKQGFQDSLSTEGKQKMEKLWIAFYQKLDYPDNSTVLEWEEAALQRWQTSIAISLINSLFTKIIEEYFTEESNVT